MPKSVTEIVTEIVTESHREWRRYDRSTGMELPTVWGNVRCIGTCDRRNMWRNMWRSMWRSMVVWERQFQRVSPNSQSGCVKPKNLLCTILGNAALSLCRGRRAARYFFVSSLESEAWAAWAWALLAEEEDLGQSLAVCPVPPQNIQSLLWKRHCLSWGVNLLSFPSLSASGFRMVLDLLFLLLLLLLLLEEPLDWFLLLLDLSEILDWIHSNSHLLLIKFLTQKFLC